MRLQVNQIDAAIELLREHATNNADGVFSEQRVRFLLEHEIDNPKTLILVNKQVSAILVFTMITGMFTTQPEIQEVCFYSKTAGSGFRLLKEAMPWLKKWGKSVRKIYFGSTGSDEVNSMLERVGMKRAGTIYEIERGT